MGEKRNKKEKLVEGKFFALLKSTSLNGDMDRDHVFWGRSYGRNCLILGWSDDAFEDAIEVTKKLYPSVSKKAIKRALTQSIVNLFELHNVSDDADPEVHAPIRESIFPTLDIENIQNEITQLLERLKNQIKKWTAYVFLEGLQLKSKNGLQLGKATLYQKNTGPFLELINTRNNARVIQKNEKIMENSDISVYLAIDMEGEQKLASDEAIQKAQDHCNILNFYLVNTHHSAKSFRKIGVWGQASSRQGFQIILQNPPIEEDSDSPGYYWSSSASPRRSFEIEKTQVDAWIENGLEKILECLDADERAPGSPQFRIFNAITWYGRAMRAGTQDEKFTGLMIALESLFESDRNTRISQRLRDSISFMIGGNQANRKQISEMVTTLYQARSQIVHDGIPASQENLYLLDELVFATISKYIQREIS